MKRRTNLSQPKINKTVKFLEEKGMIKFVKSVQNASRKVGAWGEGAGLRAEEGKASCSYAGVNGEGCTQDPRWFRGMHVRESSAPNP